ncbi:hypothetical protein HYH03_012341 [Edaphochlamys debaryana]|uniref:Rieske-like [2Fe-2S] domain-containing protein n=1 Tax=Edaphochlamys debaryana TaxID=47281 RepID=A0A836BU69_9CHLO|nr:hypothetical protein HYH03_012341 [Edaphochlamys debaryana]|eukprot:KAG2489115.1 hypothetical protein HYH03_012341 [Edaphochlamys debaryana]
MGRRVLMFWYRNEIFAVEARSPAEGAYSEGFIQAKFTQDYCIECPSTGTLFSLRDGSIQSWYPNNPVMRVLTPSSYCRPMAVYPVNLGSDAISVDVTSGRGGRAMGRGGAGTSLENNNVFSVQPTVYFEGMDPNKEAASLYADEKMVPSQQNPVVILTGIVALGATAVAGTAISIYFESLPALIGTWVSLGGAAVFYGYNYVNERAKKDA